MMKINKKLVGFVLALAMLLSLFAVNIAADGATANEVEYTVVVYLEKANIYGAQGYIEFEHDPDVDVTIKSIVNYGTFPGFSKNLKTGFFAAFDFDNEARDLKVAVELSVRGKAGENKIRLVSREYKYLATKEDADNSVTTDEELSISYDVVDYSALKAAMASKVAKETDGKAYTNASWGVVEAAYKRASDLLAPNNSSVINAPDYHSASEIADVAEALNKAIAKLEELNVNYEALSAKVTEAKALDPNNFVAVNWYEFRVALNNAESFLNRQNAQDQASIDSMLKTLTDAMAALKSIDEIYNAGFEAGKTAGNTAGYEAGFAAGKDAGKTEGYESGKKEGYEAGKLAGIEEGKLSVDTEAYYKDGFDAGYDEGYEAGYAAGLAAGKAEDKEEETTSDGESTDSKDDETTPVVDDGEEKSATIWIVLFIVFLVTTLGLAAYIVLTMVLKKKKESDNTPVVDYNIEDDADAE